MHTRLSSPVLSPRISSPLKINSPTIVYPIELPADITSPQKHVLQSQEICQWCFGDYYPCRCAEKGRNTASLIDNGALGGGIIDDKSMSLLLPSSLNGTGSLSKSLFDRNICSPVGIRSLSRANSAGTMGALVRQQQIKASSPKNIHIMKKPVLRFPVPRQSDALCKWCLGTFSPCFCEEGIPSMSYYSYRDDDNQDYDDDNDQDDGTGSYQMIRRSSSSDNTRKYNQNRLQNNDLMNGSNGNNSTTTSTRRSSKSGMSSFQRRLQSFSAENYDDGNRKQQQSYPNTVISRSSASFASNGSIIKKSRNPGYDPADHVRSYYLSINLFIKISIY